MRRDDWLAERIAFAERQIEASGDDRDRRLIWRGYLDAYRHVAEAAPGWEVELDPIEYAELAHRPAPRHYGTARYDRRMARLEHDS